MASRRVVGSLRLRAGSSSLLRRGRFIGANASIVRNGISNVNARMIRVEDGFGVGVGGGQQRRWHSKVTEEGGSRVYGFEDVVKMLGDPTETDRILIDVREPSEYLESAIPTALNIPITSHPDALLLPPDEFQDRFGFEKPPVTKEVVFYCKAGVRSRAAGVLARQAGYERVGEYRGSFLEWVDRGGITTKKAGGKGEPEDPHISEGGL